MINEAACYLCKSHMLLSLVQFLYNLRKDLEPS